MRKSSSPRETSEAEARGGEEDQCFAGVGEELVVLAGAGEGIEPAKGAFDDSARWQGDKTFLRFAGPDDYQTHGTLAEALDQPPARRLNNCRWRHMGL